MLAIWSFQDALESMLEPETVAAPLACPRQEPEDGAHAYDMESI